MATIKDIAKETGLGLATISKHLNGGAVREKNRVAIKQAIEKLGGYTVNEFARGLKTSRSKSIGVVIPELGNLFISSIITVVEDILRKSGYSVLICDCRTDENQECEAVNFLLQKRVDGIINMPTSRNGGHLSAAIEQGIPVVLIDRMLNGFEDKVNAVLVDNISAAKGAISSLTAAGHQNIGIILGPRDVYTSSQRLLGYSQAMLENSHDIREELIKHSDYTVQGGYESMKSLLKNKDISAVFVSNYEMTLGAIIAINELGVKIPEELSIIGFDNQHLAKVVRPRLTIVTQPLEQIGEATAKILLNRLEYDRKAENRIITFQTSIMTGESVSEAIR